MTICLEPYWKTFDVKEIGTCLSFYRALDFHVFNIKVFQIEQVNCILTKLKSVAKGYPLLFRYKIWKQNVDVFFFFFFSEATRTLKLNTHTQLCFLTVLFADDRLLREPIKMRKGRDGQACLWVASVWRAARGQGHRRKSQPAKTDIYSLRVGDYFLSKV